MKLSEFSTDEALDVLCTITPHVSNIVEDSAIMDAIGKAEDVGKLTPAGALILVAEKISTLIPVLLKDHRADVFGILAALNKTDAGTIGSQPVMTTMKQIKEDILGDEELIDFFKSFAWRGKTG